jgi:hypothetical protein
MFDCSAYVMNQAYRQASDIRSESGDQPTRRALGKYHEARAEAWLSNVWSVLTGRSRRLLHLRAVREMYDVHSSHYGGTRAVPIAQIRGSEGRCDDFDAEFRPLRSYTKGRWVSIALAWQKGVALPPVELIQVGDAYYVRDGHHRISVAKAWGQENIDAEVTVWEAGRQPGQRPTGARSLAVQPA